MTGLFPKASSNSPKNPQTQTAAVAQQPVQDSAAPSNAQSPSVQAAAQQAAQQQQAQQAQQQAAQQAAQQPPQHAAVCSTCGTVEAILAVRREGRGTGIGAVGGAVADGVVGNQFGRGGSRRTAMTLLGALGGGLAGNSVEKHIRSETDYSVRVHMENGHTRYFTYKNPPPFQQGERVHISNGTLVSG